MISIFVVNGEEMPRFFIKLSAAFGTDEAVDLEGAFSIITPGRTVLFQFFKSFFNGLVISGLFRWPMMNPVRFVLHLKSLPTETCRGLIYQAHR